jgi:hypothetical protein
VVESFECRVETGVAVTEGCGGVDVKRGAVFLGKIAEGDIFAVEGSLSVVKRVHL